MCILLSYGKDMTPNDVMKETPNLSYINQLSKGNTSFVKNLLDIIKKELSGEIETYSLHLKNGDFTLSAGDVHKLGHKIRILGLEEGGKVAEEYRMGILENNLRLKSDFEGILRAMLLFIEKA